MAERKGFEPLIQCYPYTFLAGRCLQPLGHLSINLLAEYFLGKIRAREVRGEMDFVNSNLILVILGVFRVKDDEFFC